ncbi:MAG: hypothetical protein RIR97_1268, partial [Pseudomonadota bacterium]
MALFIHPFAWFVMRLIIGICFAGLFATVESWINAKVTNANRARTLSVYRLVDLGSVTAAQYLVPAFGIGGFNLFAIISMALTLSLVPISVADKSSPAAPEAFRFDVKRLWQISPLATVGCVVVGLTNSTFRSLGPLYAQDLGMSVTTIANFMSAGIVGGVVLQYPLGHYSDRLDRRLMILLATIGACIAGLFLVFVAQTNEWLNIVGIFFFGAFAMPLYSLCSAHANDHAGEGEHALVSAGTLFFWSLGAIIGILFAAINHRFKDVLELGNYYNELSVGDDVRISVAVLFVLFPLYIVLSLLQVKRIKLDIERVKLNIRMVYTYAIVLVTSLTIVGNFIYIIYNLLSGEVLVRFVPKSLILLVLALFVLGYHIYLLKRDYTKKSQVGLVFMIASILLAVGSVAYGIAETGTPAEVRARKMD